MAGPGAEIIAAVAANTNYLSKEGNISKGRKKALSITRPRNVSESMMDEPSNKDFLGKYNQVKNVSMRHHRMMMGSGEGRGNQRRCVREREGGMEMSTI